MANSIKILDKNNMTPEQFKLKWTEIGGTVSPIDIERLENLNLKKDTIDFLTKSGLPFEAAPFLAFVKNTDDLYEGINKLTEQYEFIDPEFGKYLSIGYDGGGNPIVINTELNDQIEWLDHEENFSSRLMNSSIDKLADFLMFYAEFVIQILKENGENAFMDSNFSDEQFQKLKEQMTNSDSRAVTENTFWKEALDLLLVNREESLNNKS